MSTTLLAVLLFLGVLGAPDVVTGTQYTAYDGPVPHWTTASGVECRRGTAASYRGVYPFGTQGYLKCKTWSQFIRFDDTGKGFDDGRTWIDAYRPDGNRQAALANSMQRCEFYPLEAGWRVEWTVKGIALKRRD